MRFAGVRGAAGLTCGEESRANCWQVEEEVEDLAGDAGCGEAGVWLCRER